MTLKSESRSEWESERVQCAMHGELRELARLHVLCSAEFGKLVDKQYARLALIVDELVFEEIRGEPFDFASDRIAVYELYRKQKLKWEIKKEKAAAAKVRRRRG